MVLAGLAECAAQGSSKVFYDDPKTVKIRPHRQPMLKEKVIVEGSRQNLGTPSWNVGWTDSQHEIIELIHVKR